ncbi:MAG TPA: cyclic nucleotide-binding domain-containing protein [bacterium]|nr:cyclic nucleotide-binding domain-containing protein [bacterium]
MTEPSQRNGIKDLLFHPPGQVPVAPRGDAPLFRAIFSRKGKEAPDLLQFLAGIALFEMLEPKELKKVCAMVHERTYQAGELIFEQGTPGSAMYIIRSGAVEVFRQDAAGHPLMRLALLREGAFFGEDSLLDEDLRFISTRAVEATDALAFFRADLDQIIARMPVTGNKILRKVAWVTARRLEAVIDELYRAKE